MEKLQQAREIVKRYMWFSAGAGLIPIMYLDGVAVSSMQLKMLADLSKLYSVPFKENVGKAAIASLVCFVLPHAAAFGALSKAIPGLSVLAAPLAAGFAATYSWAMGNVFIQHFESGGTLLSFNPEEFRAYFKSQFEMGPKTAPVLEPEVIR